MVGVGGDGRGTGDGAGDRAGGPLAALRYEGGCGDGAGAISAV